MIDTRKWWERGRLNCLTPETLEYAQEMDRLREETHRILRAEMQRPVNEGPPSPYLTAAEAARYLNVPDSTFRKAARWIPITATCRYRREDLDAFAKGKRLKEPRAPLKGTGRKAK